MTLTIPPQPDIAAVLAVSDERDIWMRRIDQAYRDGFNDGRATACVALAEMEHHRESRRWWNEWAAKVQRIIQSNDYPDARRRQLEYEIAADQQLMAGAKKKLATKPATLSPLESCVLRRTRFERLDEGEVA